MRIIGGRFRGLPLAYPKNRSFRPTQDRVKESIFNILQPRIQNAVVLDLFCGTGGLGLEAMSRGAQRLVCVDRDTTFCQKNVAYIQSKSDSPLAISVVKQPVHRYLSSCRDRFDIILLDPPWDDLEAYDRSLKGVFEFGILSSKGLIVCEHSSLLDLASLHHPVQSQYRYGRSIVSLIYHD